MNRLQLIECTIYILFTAAKSAPSFVVEIKDQRAAEGESIKFECQFSGTPMPGIKWPRRLPPFVFCYAENIWSFVSDSIYCNNLQMSCCTAGQFLELHKNKTKIILEFYGFC